MKSRSIATAGFLGALALLPARSALGAGPVDIEIAAKAGYATNPVAPNTPQVPAYLVTSAPGPALNPNPLRLGVGGRGGVVYLGFYGGIQMTYFFGTATPALNDRASSSTHALTYGIEAGYGLTLLDMVTLRAQIGIGNATFINLGLPFQAPGSTSDLYLEPGVVALFSWRRWFVGIDANLFFVPGLNDAYGHDWKTSFAVDGQVGIRF